MSKLRPYLVGALVGVALALGAGFALSRGSGARLNADLAAAGWTLASASRANAALASSLRQLHGELDRANQLASIQQSVIAAEQSQLDDQQRLIDGISATVASAGGDLRAKIQGITDGFERLYRFYYPSDD